MKVWLIFFVCLFVCFVHVVNTNGHVHAFCVALTSRGFVRCQVGKLTLDVDKWCIAQAEALLHSPGPDSPSSERSLRSSNCCVLTVCVFPPGHMPSTLVKQEPGAHGRHAGVKREGSHRERAPAAVKRPRENSPDKAGLAQVFVSDEMPALEPVEAAALHSSAVTGPSSSPPSTPALESAAAHDASLTVNNTEESGAQVQQDASAQYNLGMCFYKGQGVEQDYKEAARLLQLAADKGNAAAQFNLGALSFKRAKTDRDELFNLLSRCPSTLHL